MRNQLRPTCYQDGRVVLASLGMSAIGDVSLAIPQTASPGALIGEVLDPAEKGTPCLSSSEESR